MRAATITPVGPPAAYLARFAGGIGLPRYPGGSAPTLALSRPAQCSLALRPARSADLQKRPFLRVLQTIRRLLIRSECFRLEREFAGPVFHRGEQCTLARRTEQSRGELASGGATTRAQVAAVQVGSIRPTLSQHARRRHNTFTSNATSSRGPHCGPSEPKLPPSGALLPRHPDPCQLQALNACSFALP